MFQANAEIETTNRVETILFYQKSCHKGKIFAVDLIIHANKGKKNCEKISLLEILVHNAQYTFYD